jgi:hypothetical protein
MDEVYLIGWNYLDSVNYQFITTSTILNNRRSLKDPNREVRTEQSQGSRASGETGCFMFCRDHWYM